MPSTKVNNIDIRYEVSGDGPTLIWLHGLIGSIDRSRAFGEGMDALAERGVRLFAWEARGHGESGYTENEADYTWAAHANDLRALVDALGIERACFGGSSMGAWVSTVFAIENPERVDKLVVVAPPPLAGAIETAQQVFCGLASLVEAVGVEQAADIVTKLPQYAEMEEKDPEQFALTREWMRTLRAETAPYAIRGLLNGPQLTGDRFGEIRAPTLIVAHPDDPIHPASSADALHAAVARSQLVMAPDMDHFRTHHDELIDTIAAFLTDASPAK